MSDEHESMWGHLGEAGHELIDGAEHLYNTAGHTMEHQFEHAGATPDEAQHLVQGESGEAPGAGEAISLGEAGYHAGAAMHALAAGDGDAAMDHSVSTGEALANWATGGLTGGAELGWDLLNTAAGGGEHHDAHHLLTGAVHEAATHTPGPLPDLMVGHEEIYHAGHVIHDLGAGDTHGAADHLASMGEEYANAVTFGGSGFAEQMADGVSHSGATHDAIAHGVEHLENGVEHLEHGVEHGVEHLEHAFGIGD